MNTQMNSCDEQFMRRALQLAARGSQTASPNPMVGAVVVCNGKIIGEGWHRRCGEGHAEVNAVASVRDKSLLPHSTIYVTLEPCSHFGKTPPCCDLIIANHIPRVVVGCVDPFAQVHGRGISRLREAGIDVSVGVLEEECKAINKKFFTANTLNRPFVLLKWAQSRDRFIARESAPVAFSTPETSMLVHAIRARYDAILIGANTAITDNPSLTVRSWSGKSPVRVLIDLNNRVPDSARIFTDGGNTIVFTSRKRVLPDNVKIIDTPGHDDFLPEMLARLKDEGINSLIVEGGALTLQRFIDARLWDEVRIETSPVTLGEGVMAPSLRDSALINVEFLSKNLIERFERVKNL